MLRWPKASALWSFQVWPVWVYALLIFLVGSLPSSSTGSVRLNDKLMHFLGFALLGALSVRALRHLWPGWSTAQLGLGGLSGSVSLGGALELWQGMLMYRSCELLDWAADALGAALGVALGGGWSSVVRARRRTPLSR